MRADIPAGWIKCKREMPPQNKDVLFMFAMPNAQKYCLPDLIALYGYFDGRMWWWKSPFDEKYFQKKYVVAWKPIEE